jgi:hypothetical protein
VHLRQLLAWRLAQLPKRRKARDHRSELFDYFLYIVIAESLKKKEKLATKTKGTPGQQKPSSFSSLFLSNNNMIIFKYFRRLSTM